MSKSKTLLIFDFDHTIVENNTDIEVKKLAKDGHIPADLPPLSKNCWTDYMQAIFVFLHQQGVRQDQYVRLLAQMSFTTGMERLLRLSGTSDQYELVIVSDSNSYFIDTILKEHQLSQFIDLVMTNPAQFDETGCIRIRYYHTQAECRCALNLCKGRATKEFIQKKIHDGVRYDRLIYVGDGTNDLCPIMKILGKSDHAFARKGYALEKLMKDPEKKIDCSIHIWESAEEITEFLGLGK